MFVLLQDSVLDSIADGIEQKLIPDVTLEKTVNAIRKFTQLARKNKRIVLLARSLVKDIPGRDFDAIADRVYDFLINTVKYQRDPNHVEWVQDAEATLRIGSGDCDDFATIAGSLLQALGIMTRIVVAQVGRPVWNHVFIEYASPRKHRWIPFDASVRESVGWAAKNIVAVKRYRIDVN